MKNFLAFTIFDNVDLNSIDGVRTLILNFIKLGLFAAGGLSVIFIIVGGLRYITSAGNPDSVTKAKKTIVYAIGGLLLAIFSFAIVNFIGSSFKG